MSAQYNKTLILSDSFKSTLSSQEIGKLWQDKCGYDYFPISDGGEGSVDVVKGILKGQEKEIEGKSVFISNDTAYIETADIVGFKKDNNNVMNENSELLGKIINKVEAETIVIFIGGTGTNDGGFGLLKALGYKFLDRENNEVDPIPLNFSKIEKVQKVQLPDKKIIACCDVGNLLYGEDGATKVFGKQKNVKDINELDEEIKRIAKIIDPSQAIKNGSGAGGGIGYSLGLFENCKQINGFDYFKELLNLESVIQNYDLIITGEGKLDSQTNSGKVPFKVLELGKKYKKKIIGVFGIIEDNTLENDFNNTYYIAKDNKASENNLRNAHENYEQFILNYNKNINL